jgi:hypothetical protein
VFVSSDFPTEDFWLMGNSVIIFFLEKNAFVSFKKEKTYFVLFNFFWLMRHVNLVLPLSPGRPLSLLQLVRYSQSQLDDRWIQEGAFEIHGIPCRGRHHDVISDAQRP